MGEDLLKDPLKISGGALGRCFGDLLLQWPYSYEEAEVS